MYCRMEKGASAKYGVKKCLRGESICDGRRDCPNQVDEQLYCSQFLNFEMVFFLEISIDRDIIDGPYCASKLWKPTCTVLV